MAPANAHEIECKVIHFYGSSNSKKNEEKYTFMYPRSVHEKKCNKTFIQTSLLLRLQLFNKINLLKNGNTKVPIFKQISARENHANISKKEKRLHTKRPRIAFHCIQFSINEKMYHLKRRFLKRVHFFVVRKSGPPYKKVFSRGYTFSSSGKVDPLQKNVFFRGSTFSRSTFHLCHCPRMKNILIFF